MRQNIGSFSCPVSFQKMNLLLVFQCAKHMNKALDLLRDRIIDLCCKLVCPLTNYVWILQLWGSPVYSQAASTFKLWTIMLISKGGVKDRWFWEEIKIRVSFFCQGLRYEPVNDCTILRTLQQKKQKRWEARGNKYTLLPCLSGNIINYVWSKTHILMYLIKKQCKICLKNLN